MKKPLPIVLFVLVVFLFFLNLTKIANLAPREPPSGTAFSLKVQHVVQCSPDEITLVDSHQTATHLEKDATWPNCSTFQKDDVLDFYLSRGEKTKFLGQERTAGWRKVF
jgi:hypothetical protein